jgi:K+-transporting ATPase A subunit
MFAAGLMIGRTPEYLVYAVVAPLVILPLPRWR